MLWLSGLLGLCSLLLVENMVMCMCWCIMMLVMLNDVSRLRLDGCRMWFVVSV